MAHTTGPISTLPGTLHDVPAGQTCDAHNDRPATHRVQGETDSFGCEMTDMCQECYDKHLKYVREEREKEKFCEWHKGPGVDVRDHRDFEEGSAGPVYQVCRACRQRELERIREEDAQDEYQDYLAEQFLDDDGPDEVEEL